MCEILNNIKLGYETKTIIVKVYNDYVTKAVKNSVKVEHYFELSPFSKQTDYPPMYMYIIIMHLHSIPMCDKSSSISIAMHRVLKTGYFYR